MRCDDLHIASLGVWLPPRVAVAEAVSRGWYDAETAARTDLASVTVAEDPPPDLAARAVAAALARSSCRPDDAVALIYATATYQGIDFWNAASYVQGRALSSRAFPVEIRQLSNGGMGALELAAGFLSADPSRRVAVVATGDRHALPAFDRWRADPGVIGGDAGAAAVLSRDGGFLRVLSLASVSDPALEAMFRGDTPFTTSPALGEAPIDLDRRQREFIARVGLDEVKRRLDDGAVAAAHQALTDADITLDDVARVVIPNLGRQLLERRYLAPFKLDLARTTWEWGRTVGHLGAADQLAGLEHLAAAGAVSPGDRLLLMGLGAGYVWTCAVVEVTERPNWSA